MADEDQDGKAAPDDRGIPDDMKSVGNIPVRVTTVLGTTTIPVNTMLKLGRGAVVELDRKTSDSIDLYANKQLVARGELVETEDGRLAVTITEILKSRLSEL